MANNPYLNSLAEVTLTCALSEKKEFLRETSAWLGEGYRTRDVELLSSFLITFPSTVLTQQLRAMGHSRWSNDHSQGYAWTHRRLLWGLSFPGPSQCRLPLMTSCPRFRDSIGYPEARVLTFQLRHCGDPPTTLASVAN